MVPQRPSGPESKDDELNDNGGRHPGGFVPRRTAAVIAATAVTGLVAAACGGAVPVRGEDLRRAGATQRVTDHKINKRTGRTGRPMKGDRR
jgi:hypothetical protein